MNRDEQPPALADAKPRFQENAMPPISLTAAKPPAVSANPAAPADNTPQSPAATPRTPPPAPPPVQGAPDPESLPQDIKQAFTPSADNVPELMDNVEGRLKRIQDLSDEFNALQAKPNKTEADLAHLSQLKTNIIIHHIQNHTDLESAGRQLEQSKDASGQAWNRYDELVEGYKSQSGIYETVNNADLPLFIVEPPKGDGKETAAAQTETKGQTGSLTDFYAKKGLQNDPKTYTLRQKMENNEKRNQSKETTDLNNEQKQNNNPNHPGQIREYIIANMK